MRQIDYITLRLPFHVIGEEARLIYWTAWLCKLCAHRLLGKVKENPLLADMSQYNFIRLGRKLCYDIIPNRRYVDGVSIIIHASLQSAKASGIDIAKLELKPWLLFQSEAEPWAKGNLNIQFVNYDTIKVLVFGIDKSSRKIAVKPVIPKGYARLVKALVDKALKKEIGYPARVYITNYGDRLGHLYGEIQVMVKYNFYLETMKKHDKPLGDNIAGIDVNVDRLNLVVINRKGDIIWKHTARFPQVTSRGYPRTRAWSIIGEAIHRILKNAYSHGASTIAVENPKTIGYLRYYWIGNGDRKTKNYNYKVSIFRNSIIERIMWKAPLYGLDAIPVNPKGTTYSKDHEYVMRRYGLDGHTASAYLIALRARRNLQRPKKPTAKK
ncbi:MAG: hypothetical protein J7K21_00615 [Desulfurococcales archaeon]|nr:hypothetical protein [Desulfurococcales archaeon]